MNLIVYNVSLLLGLALVAGGVALVSVPAALVVAGLLLIVLTVVNAAVVLPRLVGRG